MLRRFVLSFVALIGAGTGCGVGDPGMLAGSAGSPARGRGGSGGRDGGAGAGLGAGSTGTGGFTTGQNCGAVDYTLERLAPEILILLDASGSMNDDASGASCSEGCGAASKWAETVAAINATVARTDATVSWGLKFFPDLDSMCGVGYYAAVPPAPGNAPAIATALAGHTSANGGISNGGRTPTRTAEIAATAYLSTRTNKNPKFILLATDGLPNCAPDQTDPAVDDAAGTVQSIANALAAGYPTFVVGVGISDSAAGATLTQMAVAGAYPRAGSPSYYPVASTAELESALTTLVNITATCTFAVPAPPTNDGTSSRANIDVRVEGASIPRDTTHTNGWDYADASMTAVQLYGSSCEALMTGAVRTVSVVFYCPGL